MSIPGELVGRVLGWAMAPVTAGVAAVRHSRMFHPDGVVLKTRVESVATDPALLKLAERLEGPALARLSSAWWKAEKEWMDALGFALRFRSTEEVGVDTHEGDQDLLFATIRTPWTVLAAALTTQVHDFLANDYYAVSPFKVEGVGRVRWRLVSARPTVHGERRLEKLRDAVRNGTAVFTLECKRAGRAYEPLARVKLEEEVQLDQRRLRFNPFLCGRQIVPASFVHRLRPGAYAGSQKTRMRLHQTSQTAH